MEGGWAIGSFTLPLSIPLKATSHLHLGHKASITLGWTTIMEKVEHGTLGHEGRTGAPACYVEAVQLSLTNLTQLWSSFFLYLFSTYVFSWHCINLHLFACCFVSILKAFLPLTYVLCPQQNKSFLKAETMSLVSFVFPVAPFTVLSREWAYSICCRMAPTVIPPWLGLRLNSLKWNSPKPPRTGILHLACWLLLSTCYLKWLPSASFCPQRGTWHGWWCACCMYSRQVCGLQNWPGSEWDPKWTMSYGLMARG